MRRLTTILLLALSGCASEPEGPDYVEPFGELSAYAREVEVDGRTEVRWGAGRTDKQLLDYDHDAFAYSGGRYFLRRVGQPTFDEYVPVHFWQYSQRVVDELTFVRTSPFDGLAWTWYSPLLGGGPPLYFGVGVSRPAAEVKPELDWPRGTRAHIFDANGWSMALSDVARVPSVLDGTRFMVQHHAEGGGTRWQAYEQTGQSVGAPFADLGWLKVKVGVEERWFYFVPVDDGRLLQPLSASGEPFLAGVPGLLGCRVNVPDPAVPDVVDGFWLVFADGRLGWLAADHARWGQETGSGPLWREAQLHTAESKGHRLRVFLGRTDAGWSVWVPDGVRRFDAPPSASPDEARAVAIAACEEHRQQVVAALAAAEKVKQERRGEVLRLVRAGELYSALEVAKQSADDGPNLRALIAIAGPVEFDVSLESQANELYRLMWEATDDELKRLLREKADKLKQRAEEERRAWEAARPQREYEAYLARERQVDALIAEQRFAEARDLAWETSPGAIVRTVLAAREARRLADMTVSDLAVARDSTHGDLMLELMGEIDRRNAPIQSSYAPSSGWSSVGGGGGLSQQQQDFIYERELNQSIYGTDHDPYE